MWKTGVVEIYNRVILAPMANVDNVTFKHTVKNGCGLNVCCIYMVRLEKL